MQLKTIIMCTIAGAAFATAWPASANPRPLPFTYPVETLPAGELELELYGDITPLRVYANPADRTQGQLWEPAYVLQNEFELGLTDRIELGFYQVFEATPLDGGTNTMTFDGFKWEVRGRMAETGEWPVDVGLYAELETMHDELSLEGKVLLAKHLGLMHLMANLWVEGVERRPLDSLRSFHFIVNPTAGLAVQVTPTFHPGFEYWARGELGTVGDTPVDRINNAVHHFLGPTLHLNFGKLWWSLGAYLDLNNVDTPQPGEIYGPLWVRTVLGLSL
jgi:hypothetical protein